MRISKLSGPRWLVLIFLLLFAALLAWYWISPWYTLNRMAAAVEARDADAVATYVDRKAFREDAKAELMSDLLAPLEAADAGSGDFGGLLADAMIGPTVEEMISFEGLKSAFTTERPPKAGNGDPAAELSLGGNLRIDRKGLSTFLVTSRDKPDVSAEFNRSYLSWRLSGIELPKDSSQQINPSS